ncbi:NADH dehydrogenase [Buchnera aphidicola (Schlechtendalia chinensis)]|uniref:NADH-quinone oxidoreductase subunit E n=1 Tax=Buchnera aphidicola subsp. Schlechtendalia chinensis TaxID=118110 RepID=A0A172WEB6_BUCSC|nr:NADH-quinone oxidoreductase subunit NuoE [Buchnera aphidicola]ANF17297.1 NADH dehydrogenase [Buchnera aphidicola (Schlechtendalia chinensis)]
MLNKIVNDTFELSYEEIKEILEVKRSYENSRASSIEALKIVQKKRGWISRSSINAISKILRISESDLEEIATFYSQIFRKPVGRNIIRYCDSVVCYMHGCEDIKFFLEKRLNIFIGETTKDFRFTLLPTCCLGACDKAPVIMINDHTYFCLTLKLIVELLESYK